MTKRLIEKIALKNKKPRPVFIAHIDEIKEAIEAGYSITVVWETMNKEGVFPWSRPYFNKLVKELLMQNKKNKVKPKLSDDFSFSAEINAEDLI